MVQQPSFKETQLTHTRVKSAYQEKEEIVKNYFAEKGISYNGFNLFIRGFKKEQKLEIWIREKNKTVFILLQVYDFCTTSGTLGPKRKEGDLQIPEGIYHINHFNPASNFHLSLGINYPNTSDKILGNKLRPGGSIYIHGNCVTIGCIPITDDKIKELYTLAVEARNNGQSRIPVHVFPARLGNEELEILKSEYSNESLIEFWENLKAVYDSFESTKQLKGFSISETGKYVMN
jgi:murein L,D-transpeptidase YafK